MQLFATPLAGVGCSDSQGSPRISSDGSSEKTVSASHPPTGGRSLGDPLPRIRGEARRPSGARRPRVRPRGYYRGEHATQTEQPTPWVQLSAAAKAFSEWVEA